MKVTVRFGDLSIVVPCGNGELLVSELMEEAARRYKKAARKGEDFVVKVDYLITVTESARLDVDDQVKDVCENKEVLKAITEGEDLNAEGDADEEEITSAHMFASNSLVTQSESIESDSSQLCVLNKTELDGSLASEPVSPGGSLEQQVVVLEASSKTEVCPTIEAAVFSNALDLDASNKSMTTDVASDERFCENDEAEVLKSKAGESDENDTTHCTNDALKSETDEDCYLNIDATPCADPSDKNNTSKLADSKSHKVAVGCLPEDLTLEHLEWDQILELKKYLDPITQQCNWLDLGKVVFHGEPANQDDVDSLNYAGGGSPAQAFLEYFKANCGDYTVEQFMVTAEKLKRNDIVKLFTENRVNVGSKFKDIGHMLGMRICAMLSKRVHGLPNWKDFAMKVGCDDETVNEFQNSVRENDDYSPTVQLIRLIKVKKPHYKLDKLCEVLSKLGRNDVVLYIIGTVKRQLMK